MFSRRSKHGTGLISGTARAGMYAVTVTTVDAAGSAAAEKSSRSPFRTAAIWVSCLPSITASNPPAAGRQGASRLLDLCHRVTVVGGEIAWLSADSASRALMIVATALNVILPMAASCSLKV